jgi:AmmeMemoRadiSam system protein A
MPLIPEPGHPPTLDLAPAAGAAILATVDHALAAAAGCERPVPTGGVPDDLIVSGIFVSLHSAGALRGCMGRLGVPMRLGDVLLPVARLAATGDPRFPALTAAELPACAVEVWLLHGFARIAGPAAKRIDLIQVGIHGVSLDLGARHGVFLPSVASEQGWDAAALLAHLGRKAGLDPDAWRDEDAILRVFLGLRLASGTMESA